MTRQKLQDVVPQRSIRDIPVPGKRAVHTRPDPMAREREQLMEKITRKHEQHRSVVEDAEDFTDFDEAYDNSAQRNFTKWGFWFIATAGVLFFIFSIILFFAGATVTVTPKQNVVAVNKSVSARPDTATSTNTLTYQVLTLSKEVSTTIPLGTSSVSTIDKQATGKITIANSFSATPVVLVKNTRFESPEGLIFRINEAVRVPGYTTKNGVITPGYLDVNVYADEAGSKYNIGITNFTVPGFKTDAARYAKVTARSKTDMIGGIAKNEPEISGSSKQAITEQLQAQIKDTLIKDLQVQKPVDSVLYDTAYTIEYSPVIQKQNSADTILITEQGTIHAVTFNKKSLSRALLGNEIEAIGGEVEIRGIEDLVFSQNNIATGRVWEQNPLLFTLQGPLTIIGVIDAEKLAADLTAKSNDELQSVINQYPTILKATATIRPFWKSIFPADSAKIKINTVKI